MLLKSEAVTIIIAALSHSRLSIVQSPNYDSNPTSQTDNTFEQVSTVLWLLIAVCVVAVASRYIKVPYTIALVLAGLGIAFIPGIVPITLTPDLIVIVFLPALLFEASYNLSFDQLRRVFRFIGVLAFWGVLGCAGLVGGLLIWLGGLPWQTALLFGAIVAATDPISVVSTFRKLGAPRRLTTIIEGESLFNDGAALVFFNILLGVIVSQKFSPSETLIEFIKVAVGGLVLGSAIGYLGFVVLSHLENFLTETLVTLIVAYGTFLGAETIGVSPALAVVAAGLLVGNIGRSKGMSASSRVAVGLSWELIGFIANSLIFLLVGLEIRAVNFNPVFWWVTMLGIAATSFSRGIIVVIFSGLNALFRPAAAIPLSWQLVMIWGGLRGSLSLALALSLPATLANGSPFPDRDELLVMTFGVILFTLLVQGLTIEPLIKVLKLGRPTPQYQEQYELLRGQLVAVRAALVELKKLRTQGLIGGLSAARLENKYGAQEKTLAGQLGDLQHNDLSLQEEQLRTAQQHLLQVEKDAIRDLHSQGIISEESLRELWSVLDTRAVELEQEPIIDPNSEEDVTEVLENIATPPIKLIEDTTQSQEATSPVLAAENISNDDDKVSH